MKIESVDTSEKSNKTVKSDHVRQLRQLEVRPAEVV